MGQGDKMSCFWWGWCCFLGSGPIASTPWGWPLCFPVTIWFACLCLLHLSCLMYIDLCFACTEWDFWEARNDKTQLSFPARFPPYPFSFSVCLGFQFHHHIQQSLGQRWRKKKTTNPQHIQLKTRHKHLFCRFYIITKQNQERRQKKNVNLPWAECV